MLVLFDEVLNFLSGHRDRAEAFRDFLGNLVRAMTGTTGCAAMLSLPQSKPEMSNYDLQWQAVIEKEVGRVAKRLIANDEAEIGEVVRRRLVEDLGPERVRKRVAKAYADWCFERRAQLPPEWTAIDTATSERNAREHLQARFEACYPFHPATLSVFQRKWQALPQYQQTRGTLAMLAQWIAWAAQEHFRLARTEPLISLGSAPLHLQEFRGVVLGQLGEPRLNAALDADIAGAQAHARALDADLVGPLRDLHRRVGTAIFFESTGGQSEKVAHLAELRFAIGEPELDTTSIDNAALALEARAFFLRRVGSDGFQVRHQATLKKAKNDRRASLDEDSEVRPAIAELVRREFEKGASVPVVTFPDDSATIPDSPRLTLVVADPGEVRAAESDARDEVWASYRFVVLADRDEPNGLRIIDLGAGHASASETLVGRIITALKTEALVNESVGAGYIERNWPTAFRETGAWPLSGLRKSFVDGSLTRLLDPDRTLRGKLVEFVERGEFGLSAGARADGSYTRVWYREPVSVEEVDFSQDVYLLRKDRVPLPGAPPADAVRSDRGQPGGAGPQGPATRPGEPVPQPSAGGTAQGARKTIWLAGTIPPEVWNRLGTKVIPKLRRHRDVVVSVAFELTAAGAEAETLKAELTQVVGDLDLANRLRVSETSPGAGDG